MRPTSTSSGARPSLPRAGWFYPRPTPGFTVITDAVAVMPGQVDRCVVDG